jgi:hypothetical protein
MSVKFPVEVYTFSKGPACYEMTEKEMEDKCCIFELNMYFRDSIPEEQQKWMDTYEVTLYDICNWEAVPWWEWPQELKEIMYEKVPMSRPENEEDDC